MTRTASVAALAAAFALGGAWMLTRADAPEAGAAVPGAASAQAAATTGAATDGAAADEAAPTDASAAAIPDMTVGAADAPIEVIEYGSFTCPHCADFHADQFQQLKADWIDTGRVRFTFREVYFDRFGLWASMVARCGGEMRFFGIHDMLYEGQQEWIGDQQPQTIADNLKRIGLTAGLDQAALDACLADEAQAEALVAWFQENAERDGITATPTFLIDGEAYQNMPWTEFEAVLEEKLAD
jgi:protein-disulfide isomerase